MMPSSLKLLLILKCSLHLFTISRADFSFTVTVFSYTTSGTCDAAFNSACETFINSFCLRGPRGTASQSTDNMDCPLGRSRDDVYDSGTITITSNHSWPVTFILLKLSCIYILYPFREDFNS